MKNLLILGLFIMKKLIEFCHIYQNYLKNMSKQLSRIINLKHNRLYKFRIKKMDK